MEKQVEAIIYETFDYEPDRAHADLTPVEIIGVIKEWHYQHLLKFISNLVPQSRTAKWFFTDERLDARGLLKKPKTKWPHANDAMRHLLYFQKAYV